MNAIIDGIKRSVDYFGDLKPERVLVEYNGLRIFTFSGHDGRLLFAYLSDEDSEQIRYTVVPSSNSQIERLVKGDLTLVHMLTQPWGWVVDINHYGEIISVLEVEPATLPEEYRPAHNAYLPGAKKYDFSVRLLGPTMSEESAPLSSMKYASERTMATVQGLAKYVIARNDLKLFGDKQARELSDLPVSGILLASLEVDMKMPKVVNDRLDDAATKEANFVATEIERLLNKVIAWAATPDLMDKPENEPEESVAILNAIEKLTPSGRNNVQEVQLGGRLVSAQRRRTVSLSKELRPKIRASMKSNMNKLGNSMPRSIPWPDLIRAVGKVTNADVTLNTFLLREVGPVFLMDQEDSMDDEWSFGDFILFTYDEKRWRETVIRSLDTGGRMIVVGKLVKQADAPEGTILAYSVPQYRLLELELETKDRKNTD
ncbi:MAG: hypothetical protein C0467_13075 [Planctomycetaceae bacterium]|nr:hypothetical protein [Planctomycetaceae bacterium]